MHRVERYAIEPLPKDSVVEGNINNIDAVSDALSAATSDSEATSRIWRCAAQCGRHQQEDSGAGGTA